MKCIKRKVLRMFLRLCDFAFSGIIQGFQKQLNEIESAQKRIFDTVAGPPSVFLPTQVMDEIRINQGLTLAKLDTLLNTNLVNSNFKIFSQFGGDGILQNLTRTLDLTEKTFIEFGAADFTESNCRFLMMTDNWSGFIIDASIENIQNIESSYYYWKFNLKAMSAYINRDNINFLLSQSGLGNKIGVLSIDLDGNDYYILESINEVESSILICEFNAVFGPTRKIATPYKDDFDRRREHYCNLYFGASLPAINFIAEKKGYALVAIDDASVNAFFVKEHLLNETVVRKTVEEVFQDSKFRESLNTQGDFTYVSGKDRATLLMGLPVFNVETKKLEPF
jgi:hypothetical protein